MGNKATKSTVYPGNTYPPQTDNTYIQQTPAIYAQQAQSVYHQQQSQTIYVQQPQIVYVQPVQPIQSMYQQPQTAVYMQHPQSIAPQTIYKQSQQQENKTAMQQNKTNIPNVTYTEYARSAQNNHEMIKIEVRMANDNLFVYALYSKQETLRNIFTKIIAYHESKHYPLKCEVCSIDFGSFTGYKMLNNQVRSITNKSITDYEKDKIIQRGIEVKFAPLYYHKVNPTSLTCPYMAKLKTNNPLHCPIYYRMKEEYQFSKEGLYHLIEFSHFLDEFEEKPICKYHDSCKAYIRCENGEDKINDICHMKLYRHPPRCQHIKLSENIHSLIINKSFQETEHWKYLTSLSKQEFDKQFNYDKLQVNHQLYEPTYDDKQKYGKTDGFLTPFIKEIISNGFKYDLCLECGRNDECKHNDYSILKVVDDKMNHLRHKQIGSPLNRAQMLSLILYTGGDCNYNLCDYQRKGNYTKWKWFDYHLYCAINQLSQREYRLFQVYTGLNGVKLNQSIIESGFFATYTSTSWNKDVAKSFMKGQGMIIQIDKNFLNDDRIRCCDVSWISKFPDEGEILFARSKDSLNAELSGYAAHFKLKILDETNGVQTVSLTKK